jgi:hypothetical protein
MKHKLLVLSKADLLTIKPPQRIPCAPCLPCLPTPQTD